MIRRKRGVMKVEPSEIARWRSRGAARRAFSFLGCMLAAGACFAQFPRVFLDTNSSDRWIYTVMPPSPAAAPGEVARAAASQSDYAALPGLYSRGQTAPTGNLQSAGAMVRGSNPGKAAKAKLGWPMRGKDPANTGHTGALGPAVQARPAWIFRPDASAFVWRPAVAPDGTIYVTTASFAAGVDGRLYALRPDGSVKWQTPLTNSSGLNLWASATPVVDGDGNIYVAWAHDLDFGSLTAISLDPSGAVRWRFEPRLELEFASHQQPALGQGVLYAAADTGFFFDDATQRASIFALSLATGKPIWHWTSPNLDTFFDGPAVGHDGYIYHASASNPLRGASGYLYRIRPDGEPDWSVDIGVGVNQAPPVIDAQSNIYIGDGAGVAFKYSPAGARLWTYDTTSGQIYYSPVLNGTRVTVGAAFGVHVLDADTGKREGVFAPDSYPFGQASDRAGNIFFYCFDLAGTVFGFGRGGRQWWTFETGASSTVNAVAIAGDGKLLVSNSETLQAYVAPVLGDLNCDGDVNELDIEPYFLALGDPVTYAQRYPQCHRSLADVDGDGTVDASDLLPFFRLLD